jgi:hypothetical protein
MSLTYHSSQTTYDFDLVSSVRQHFHNTIVIGFGHERVDIEVPFSFISFLSQYVARVGMAPLDLSSGGSAKPFRCAFVCF